MERMMKTLKNKKESSFGFFYLMTVGVLLAWVMAAGIIDTTIFQRDHVAGLIRMFFIVGIFGLFFIHKYITRVGIALLVLLAIFIASGFFYIPTPDEPNIANRFAELVTNTIQFLTGTRPYDTAYERLTIWMISIFFGFFVVFFSYRKFHFWILFVVSIATTSLAITSPYFRTTQIFYVYAFCILALAIKYLHEKNISKMAKPPKRSLFIKLAIPLIAGVEIFASTIPRPPTVFAHGTMRDILRTPFDFVNDVFLNITQQSEFSLRQIGFGERGGRLGGDIEANDDIFMRINTNVMPIYLTGATRDTYTGYSWLSLHSDYHAVDFDVFDQNIELLEWFTSSRLWLSSHVEIVESGRLVQIDTDDFLADQSDRGIHWRFDDEELDNLRIFIDETSVSDISIWTFADQSIVPNWFHVEIDLTTDILRARGRIKVNNLDRRLTSIFHTGIVGNINSPVGELSFLRNRDGRLLSEQRLRNNTNYTVYHHAHDPWYSNSGIIEQSYVGILHDISQMFETFKQNYGYDISHGISHGITSFGWNDRVITYGNLLNNYLIPRADLIYEIYTTLPDDFPERVHELALEVTEGASSNYEKMRLLESFLSEDFDYTLTPGPSPTDQDFVDHFLFDLRQGYCVHFASAFVTMARSLGMPTRYVEGFHVNDISMRGEDMYVLNRMAHAWPEVYFEGYGWQRFEPTPASGLEQQQESPTGSTASGTWIYPEYWYMDWIDYQHWYPSINGYVPSGGQQQGIAAAIDNMAISGWALIGLVVLLVVVVIFVRMIIIFWKISRIRKRGNNEVAIHRFKVLLSYLNFLGFGIKDTETAIQFAGRIRNSFSNLDFEKDLLKSSSEVFAKARYSQQKITDVECKVLEKLIQRMDNRVQLELGKWRYFIYRYILAIVYKGAI